MGRSVAIWDLIVVGGGPAGAAAALRARQVNADARVLLLDKARFPRDKACGDGIAAGAVAELASLGTTVAVSGYQPVRCLRIRTPTGLEVAGTLEKASYVIPRTVFDARLIGAAAARGVRVRTETVRTVRPGGAGVLVNERDTAPVLVAADGANSTVRRLLGIAANPSEHLAIAVRAYTRAPAEPPEQRIELIADRWPSYVWWFPVGDGTANVGYGLLRSRLREGHELYGQLRRLLPDAEVWALRGHHLPLSSHRPDPAPAVGGGRVLLAGDAASLANPLSGEGIYYALVSGRLAGNAAIASPHDPAGAYRRGLGATLGVHLRHTAALSRLARHRRFVDASMQAAARSPDTFGRVIRVALEGGTADPGLLLRVAAYLLPGRSSPNARCAAASHAP